MKQKKLQISLLFIVLLSVLQACKHDYTPKPRGFMKISYPEKKYIRFDDGAPFSFNYPEYSQMLPDTSPNAEPWWYNLYFPDFDATIYLSYKQVNDNLNNFVDDSRSLAYKHSIKADAIDEILIRKPEIPLFGIIYDMKGNTASSLQFFLTDSVHHFIRGSLYFNTSPEKDSLAPVIGFIRQDVNEMIESLEWRKY